MQIHLSQPAGDILIFMTGQEDIIAVCTAMTERLTELGDQVPAICVLPANLLRRVTCLPPPPPPPPGAGDLRAPRLLAAALGAAGRDLP